MKYSYVTQLLKPFYQRHLFPFVGGVILLILVDLLQLLIPRLTGYAIDSFAGHSDKLNLYLASMLGVGIAVLIGRYGYRQLLLGTTRRLEDYLRRKLFFHSLRLPLGYYDQNGPGKVMALMTNDITAIRVALGFGSILFVDAIIMGLASFIVMARMVNIELSMAAILPLPLTLLATVFMGRTVHRRFRHVQEKFSELTEFSQEMFAAVKVIKGFAAEPTMLRRFTAVNERVVDANMSLNRVQAAYIPVSHVLPLLCYAIALYLGGKLIITGEMTVGDLTAFMGYLGLIIWPIMGMGFLINMVQRGLASLERIGEFLNLPAYETQTEVSLPMPGEDVHTPNDKSPSLVFDHLTFHYANGEKAALTDLSFTIQPGTVVGLVGRTGSGKSTLLKLLMRLYDPPTQAIYINGQEIHEIDFSRLRQMIGYVPQDNVLFSQTIGENIAFDQEYPEEQIRTAARLAAITEDIHSKPEGFDTRLGEKGKKLSGGQQQRVAIARALIKNSPLLLFDDVFSALDYETELRLLKNLREFIGSRTTILVSQRIAAVSQCDHIIVLDQGRVCEAGSHADLVAKQGLYYEIYKQQLINEEVV